MLLRVWEEEKAAPDPDIAMQGEKTPEIFEKRVCSSILFVVDLKGQE